MNNSKDIHNEYVGVWLTAELFYQDFNEQFEGYTQLRLVVPHAVAVVLSGFQ